MPHDPLVLGFDTSAAHCAAALLCGNNVISECVVPMKKGQAEHLMPMLETLLTECNVNWSDLAAIGVGIGPGNFTGIRISVAAARGLALSLAIPAIGVSSFEALRFDTDGVVIVSVPAPRDSFYLKVLGGGEYSPPLQCDLQSMPPLPARAEPTVIGHLATEIALTCSGHAEEPKNTLPVGIAKVAYARRHNDAPRPAPLYVRAADAAPPRDPAPVILD